MYSALSVDRDGRTYHGWRSFRLDGKRLSQTVFYLDRRKSDAQEYDLFRRGTMDAAAQRLLGELVDEAGPPPTH